MIWQKNHKKCELQFSFVLWDVPLVVFKYTGSDCEMLRSSMHLRFLVDPPTICTSTRTETSPFIENLKLSLCIFYLCLPCLKIKVDILYMVAKTAF